MADSFPKVRVAAVQAASAVLDREASLDKLQALAERAADAGACLIATPRRILGPSSKPGGDVLRKALCLVLSLGLSWQPASAQTTTDPDVAKGIRQIEDGDIDAGIVTLDLAARRLAGDPLRVRDLAQAYLYIGIGYLGKGQEALAKARFRAAVTQVHELTLSRDQYPPKVLELFDAAKQEVLASTPSPGAPAASPQPSSPPPKKSGSKTPLILAGIAVAGGAGVAVAAGGGGGGSATAAPSNYRVDASDAQSFPSHGGGGGSFQMPCPTGSLMVGITGRSDTNVVLSLAARCAILASDGSFLGEVLLSTVPAVNQFGPANFDDHCPAGQAVVSVSGYQGQAPIGVVAIRSLGIGCANVREWVASGTRGQVFAPHGLSDGTPFADQCNSGYAVTSFTAGSGSVSTLIIERLATTCTRIRP